MNMLPTQTFNSWNFNRQRKTKRFKSRILYHSNSTASYQVLIRSGDISLNPGPAKCGSGIQSAGSKQRTSGIVHTGYPRALNVTFVAEPSGRIKKASSVRFASVSNI